MNLVALSGRLTRDPELKYGESGTAFCNFNIAVDRRFKKEGGKTADFFNCVAFGQTAEFVGKYLTKGRLLEISGELNNSDPYPNKDGVQVYPDSKIVVNFAKGLEKKETSDGVGKSTQEQLDDYDPFADE